MGTTFKLPIVQSADLPSDLKRLQAAGVQLAATILENEKKLAGYGLIFGAGDGQLAEALARQSNLHLIVIEPDVAKVKSLRERWTYANLYGTHIAIVEVDGATGMVEMALHKLEEKGIGGFTPDQRAQIVGNLLVVLCSEQGAQPVIRAG